ncbi:MAG: polyphosphate polymerase domain-containing protein [Lachnospiraceae bacterium]
MAELLDVLRTEQKYQLNRVETAQMSYRLGQVLHRDAHSSPDGYLVRSLYFDTPDNTDFYDKVDGYENRRKIRLRIYSPNDSHAKLELKEKQGSLQRKRSLVLQREDAMRLCEGDYQVLLSQKSEFALELYGRMQQFLYRPKCLIEYNRIAFVVPENDTRVTLDFNLRAAEGNNGLFAPNPMLYPIGEPGIATMEVKFNRFLLSYVKALVSNPVKMQISASKYGMARNKLIGTDM